MSPPDGWTSDGAALSRTWTFATFPDAAAFVVRLALLAERRDHHPDLTWSYTRVEVRLRSHDVGAITRRDVGFAEAVNAWD